ncbi:hypothetical protein RRG08_000055 [Elysia crispata]|uniref:Uncharacterized protein n=1 Tax=Elysia crispata TaxID=231223 RepID=A0AAE0Z7V5_9GAST|nr:hypothetical protein RRG08_000055 [Elysia crispata]
MIRVGRCVKVSSKMNINDSENHSSVTGVALGRWGGILLLAGNAVREQGGTRGRPHVKNDKPKFKGKTGQRKRIKGCCGYEAREDQPASSLRVGIFQLFSLLAHYRIVLGAEYSAGTLVLDLAGTRLDLAGTLVLDLAGTRLDPPESCSACLASRAADGTLLTPGSAQSAVLERAFRAVRSTSAPAARPVHRC